MGYKEYCVECDKALTVKEMRYRTICNACKKILDTAIERLNDIEESKIWIK